MVEIQNFPKAYVEVHEILRKLPQEDFEKIENDFINLISNKKDKNYFFELDFSKDLENQKLLKETKLLLAYVFLNYLGTEEEKRIIKNKFKNDLIQIEEEKRKKYSSQIFKEKKKTNNKISHEMVLYKEENAIKKFIKQIFNFFKKEKTIDEK